MEKLAEDIWKAVWCSLAASVAVVGFLRYFDQEHWWQVEKNFPSEEYENNSLVYYSIKNGGIEGSASADLFVNNIPQEETWGEHGVFENILPGQIISLRVKLRDLSILSPVFRLREGEIRHLVFELKDNRLNYLGSNSRVKKIITKKIVVFEKANNTSLSQLGFLRDIEYYKPLHTAVAKVEAKNVLDNKRDTKPNTDSLHKMYNEQLFFYLLLSVKNNKAAD